MLAEIVASQYTWFTALAESWLAGGAAAFEVRQAGRSLARWPAGNQLQHPSLVVPIRAGDAIQGDLRVFGAGESAAKARLTAEARLVSHLIRLEAELQSMTAELVDSQDQLLAVYQITQSIRGHVTIDQILRCLVREATDMIKADDGFAIFVPTDDAPTLIPGATSHVDESIIWRCFWQAYASEREVLLVAERMPGALPAGIHNLIFIPIRFRGAVIAGLGLLNKPGHGFTASDIKLARAIAEQASAQIENVRLCQEAFEQAKLQTEMELARRVQLRLLLQPLPQVGGLDLFAHSRPALQVGGDFYDFIHQADRPFIFSVGDVTGKGLPAALLMTMTRMAIHSNANFIREPTPQAVMRNSNKDLYDDFTQVGMFATAFIGQYEPNSRKLLYANAGHSPVIYRAFDGTARMLEADSTAMGVLEVNLCNDHVLPFRPGDLLIVATDGFSEMRNAEGEMFSYERLLCLAEALAEKTAREIADALFDAVDRFGMSRPQDDDQTIVVIKGIAA